MVRESFHLPRLKHSLFPRLVSVGDNVQRISKKDNTQVVDLPYLPLVPCSRAITAIFLVDSYQLFSKLIPPVWIHVTSTEYVVDLIFRQNTPPRRQRGLKQ